MRHIIPISGKDSLATAIVQHELQPELNYEYVFNPTGLELPEVLEWIKNVGKYFGKEINIVGKPLYDIIVKYDFFLPSRTARYCTKESKIFPFLEWINKEECFVYYGMRADEQREGLNTSISKNITSVYPLKNLGIGMEQVYIIVNKFCLKPPTFFWEEIYEKVKKYLGYDPKNTIPEWMFDMLFAWRSRSNCDRCFNQRLYEWVGLLEHHPDRYWEASEWESIGVYNYTWNGNNKSLKQIAEEKEIIKNKRVLFIVNQLMKKKQRESLFGDENYVDVLSFKSCGLFCGK